MIKKILIANRGEIACRIIKTAKKMGISTVAVYSSADAESLHVKMADEAIAIGNAPSNESYLLVDKILDAAKQTAADAIHPGYGFLSENVVLRQACDDQGVIFIGPSTRAINAMGSKSAAKSIMDEAGVPLVPGYHGEDQNPDNLKKIANEMGYPVLLKASAGGGGKGMRQVWSADEFDEALNGAKRESLKFFSDDKMLIEKYLTKPRHVEVQVFCDEHGNGVYLADRDCSIQRRHQKVIEEAPAPNIADAVRIKMGDTAVRAAKAIDYCGAGTIEFLLDEDNTFYFMEMNTRLQVEHPVTEMVTKQDLVEWQINVANGQELPLSQDQVSVTGHAFEARIYAEDPDNDFLPASGRLTTLLMPVEDDTVRVDTGVTEHDSVSIFYDPMIAKLIVWGETRDAALALLSESLEHCQIGGVQTNLRFLYNLASQENFKKIQLDTGFIEKNNDSIFKSTEQDKIKTLMFGALYYLLKDERHNADLAINEVYSPWSDTKTWRMNQAKSELIPLFVGDVMHEVIATQFDGEFDYSLSFDRLFSGITKIVNITNAHYEDNILSVEFEANTGNSQSLNALVVESDTHNQFYTREGVFASKKFIPNSDNASSDDSSVTAVLHGTIVALLAKEQQEVKKGDALLVMEAMKMENTITAPSDGIVNQFHFKVGDIVESGALLLDFELSE
jgi:3-methylcrotonyl-CoA carboxylase alpha subunit